MDAPTELQGLELLSSLLLAPAESLPGQIARSAVDFDHEHFTRLLTLATSHHVIMRAFPSLAEGMKAEGSTWTGWVQNAVQIERARIDRALEFLDPICQVLAEIGDVVVIKSLDHWPDLGNDLDLYTNARAADVVALMFDRFQARADKRSWGDRVANKWNFIIPGLPELVEVHVGRLGQTGEQVALTERLVSRARTAQFGAYAFRVPSPEDRIVISTLQRMYRHFYFRLCDVADLARLIESTSIDYVYLESLSRAAGLWDGLATYLAIVSEYVEQYRGNDLVLPASVLESAQFGHASIYFEHNFLRIPVFPEAAQFYAKEWTTLLRHGELRNTLRLSLLPSLAAAAALSFKLTGQDKGIW